MDKEIGKTWFGFFFFFFLFKIACFLFLKYLDVDILD
jgi:hypothetical protein